MKMIRSANLESLARLSAFVQGRALSMGYDRDQVLRLCLAVEELVVNVIRHAYAGRSDGHLCLELLEQETGMVLHLHDWGVPYEAPSKPPTLEGPAQEREAGGLGLYLIQALVGELTYQRVGDMNHWCLAARAPETKTEVCLCPT